jgi:phage baseplate assembly protein W
MRRDIDLSFKKHPLTGDLATKTGSSAIRQSLINIVRTNFYDRGFNVEMGTNLDASMFENIGLTTARQIHDNIENAIRNFEPQVELIDIEVRDTGGNEVSVKIYYTELNNPTTQALIVDLSRIR